MCDMVTVGFTLSKNVEDKQTDIYTNRKKEVKRLKLTKDTIINIHPYRQTNRDRHPVVGVLIIKNLLCNIALKLFLWPK